MKTEKILEYLGIFKNFPTYQFERRIDAFMLPYLEKGIKNVCKIEDDNFMFVYPEFPLKRLTKIKDYKGIKLDKLSEYADYLFYSPKYNTVYLVEFKTDVKSIKADQFRNYIYNCQIGWESLIEYYFDKAINNQNWRKFVHGLIHIENVAPELLGINNNLLLEPNLLKPRGIHIKLAEIKNKLSFKQEPKVKFIYLAPDKAKERLDTFFKDFPDLSKYYMGLVTLNQFADYVTDTSLKKLLKEIDPKEKMKDNAK